MTKQFKMTKGSINYKMWTQGWRWALNPPPPTPISGFEILCLIFGNFDSITTQTFHCPQLAMFTPFVLRFTLIKTHTFFTEGY